MFRNKFDARVLFDKDEGGDSGGSGTDTTTSLPDAVMKSFERLLARHGNDASAVGTLLFDENKQLRETVRALQGKVPAEGATVLSADEAKEWQAYRALGAVADIKQGLEQRTQLQGQVEEAQRGETLRSVAEAAGYKPSVLTQLDRMAKAQGKALTFEVRDQTVDGSTVRTPFVKDGDTEQSLTEYAAAQWADFMPALTVPAPESNGNSRSIQDAPTPGLRFPAQHPGGGSGPQTTKTVAENTLKKAYADRRVERKPAI